MCPVPPSLLERPPSDVPRSSRHGGRSVFPLTHWRIAKRASDAPLPKKATHVPLHSRRSPLLPRRRVFHHRHDSLHSPSTRGLSADTDADLSVADVREGVAHNFGSQAGTASISSVASDSSSESSTSMSANSSSTSSPSGSASVPCVSPASPSTSISASVPALESASTSASIVASSSASASASSSASAPTSASASASTSASASASATLPFSPSVSASASAIDPPLGPSFSSAFSSSSTSLFPFPAASTARSSLPSSPAQTSSFTSLPASLGWSSPAALMPTFPTRPVLTHTSIQVAATSAALSSTKSAALSTSAPDTAFAHNVGAIIGVSLGGLAAVIIGVFVVFFVGTRYKQRRATAGPAPKMMSQSGGWRSPFAGEDDSFVGGADAGTGEGYEERPSADAGDSLEHVSSEHGHTARFVQAGATEPGLWYSSADASVPPASMSHDHSSQSYSGPQTGGSSSISHGALQPSSDLAHTSPPSSRTCLPTPASSSERGGVVELFERLRRKRSASAPAVQSATSPPPRFVPWDPAAPQRRPSSLLNPRSPPPPPVPTLVLPPSPTLQDWPSADSGAAAVLPAFAPPDGLGAPEGLLRPGPTHSTRTLGDHVDYSRPIAYAVRPGFGMRANSGTTWASSTSLEVAVDQDGG